MRKRWKEILTRPPQAFEKPDGTEPLDRSWQFKLWRDQDEDVQSELSNMLLNIMELFPPNVWTQNNSSLYRRVLRECVNL